MNVDFTSKCRFCQNNALDVDTLPRRERAYVNDRWRVVVHRSALAGWLLIVPRRHVESLADLTPEEAREVGLLLRGATACLKNVVGCEKTYVMMFAEGQPHVHFSITPRMKDMPEDRQGAAALAYNRDDEPISESQRDSFAERLGAAWPDTLG